MLSDEGGVNFVDELLSIINRFLDDYEAKQGPFRSPLERGLIVSYALGVLRCQLDAVWDALGDSPVFGALHPKIVFQECVTKDELAVRSLREQIEQKLREEGWFAGH